MSETLPDDCLPVGYRFREMGCDGGELDHCLLKKQTIKASLWNPSRQLYVQS